MTVIIKELQDAVNLQEFKSATNRFSTILSATNNFSDENLITVGAFGKLYKGQLLWNGNLMNFTVRRLDCMHVQEEELQTELSTLKSLKHKNIISVLGHYDGNDEKIIIYEQAFHGTLDQHLSDPALTLSQRLKICLGVAHALQCFHYDVIHCDINSSKIILDKAWEPKIYGFELSTDYPQSLRHRLLYSRYFGSNNMTPESDVYSFGVLLLEVLCGRKLEKDDAAQEDLDKIIGTDLRKQMDTEWGTKFKHLAYECLNPRSVKQPTVDEIVRELEVVSHLQLVHENDAYSKADEDEDTSSNTFKMEFLKIPLSEIKRATNDFNEECVVGSGGHSKIYRAELDVLDIQRWSSMSWECKEELPKIRKTVAIKRLFMRGDSQDERVFITELEILGSCKHKNIVSLLGFSTEEDERILVIEYAANGCLDDYYDTNKFNFSWAQRLQICLDAANAINYLHTNTEGKPWSIHRDIKSGNILLDENLNTKLADFGLSKFHHRNKEASVIFSQNVVGTFCYTDPEYLITGKYRRESDTYSFGVVLFEILSGRGAYDSVYTTENDIGLAPIARKRFNEGTLKKLIDPKMTDEAGDHIFSLNRGPNQDSFNVFSEIAYQCLAETHANRPTMEKVIKELQNALNLQEDIVVLTKFLLADIVVDESYCIGLDTNGKLYKAELDQFIDNSSLVARGKNNNVEPSKKCVTVAVKRITSRNDGQGKQGLVEEFEMRAHKHPNIVSLLGFCDEGDEMMFVYEHFSEKCLDDYMKSKDKIFNFTWTHRLRMCLEIARGLHHLHTKMVKQSVIRSDIRSANILLDENGVAKIGYFVISKLHPANQDMEKKVYVDPEFETTGKLEIESDIYSFAVVLFEIFCGKVAYDPVYTKENDRGLAPIARQCFDNGTIDRIMDPRLKEETGHQDISDSVDQASLNTFLEIAYGCLGEAAKRPTMEMVIKELKRASDLQDPKHVEIK